MSDYCPRCGCPAYRTQGKMKTFTEKGELTDDVLLTIASCCNCGLELHRLPGKGTVSTYPAGPFDEGGAAS